MKCAPILAAALISCGRDDVTSEFSSIPPLMTRMAAAQTDLSSAKTFESRLYHLETLERATESAGRLKPYRDPSRNVLLASLAEKTLTELRSLRSSIGSKDSEARIAATCAACHEPLGYR